VLAQGCADTSTSCGNPALTIGAFAVPLTASTDLFTQWLKAIAK
jgi:hypothetical protein